MLLGYTFVRNASLDTIVRLGTPRVLRVLVAMGLIMVVA